MDIYKIDINFVNKVRNSVVNNFHYENILATDFTKHTATGIDGHEQSTLDVTLKPDETLFRALLNNKRTYEIQVEVTVNDTKYFTGIMRDTISYSVEEALKPISFQVLDYSYKLETKPLTKSILYDFPIKIYNDATDGDEIDIITTLVATAGIDVSDLRKTSILNPNFKIGYFKVDTDKTYADMLDDLCEQYGLSYYFKDGDEIKLVNLFPETIVPAYTLTDSQLLQPLTIEKREIEEDGVTVTWQKTAIKSDRYVFRQFSDPDDNELIVNGYYFPANANNKKTYQTLSNVQNTKTTLIDTSNEHVIFTAEEGVNLFYENYDEPLKARVYFKNTATDLTSKRLYNFDIKADIVTLSEEYTHTISGDNIEEFDGSYIDSTAEAEYLANIIKSKQQNQIYKLEFSSKYKYNVGQFIEISDYTTGINLTVFIETQDITANNPIYTYTGTSASDLTFVTSTVSSTVPSDSYSSISEVTSLIDSLETLESTVASAQDITSVSEDLADITTRLETAEASVTTNATDIYTIADDIRTTQATQVSQATEMANIQTSITDVNTSIDETNASIVSADNAIDNIETAVENIEAITTTQAETIAANKTAANNAVSTVQSNLDNSITDTNLAVASVNSEVEAIKTLNTAQGLAIAQNENDITLKANQTTLDTLSGAVSNNATAISVNATGIATKVSQTSFNTLAGTVSSNATAITQNANDIELKASQTDLNTTNETVESNTASITVNANAIELKASQTSLNDLAGTVSTHGTSITANAEAIELKATKTELDTATDNIENNTSAIEINATGIATKVSQTSFNTLAGTVSSHGTSITQNAEAIELKASEAALETTNGILSTQGIAIGVNATAITTKANQTSLNTTNGNVSSNATSITQNANAITSLATRTTSTEENIVSQGTAITQNAEAIELKATQTDLDTANGNIASQGTAIGVNSEAITAIATRTTSAEGNISTNATSITANAEAIELKATQTDLDTANESISANSTSITANAKEIALKATQTSLDTANESISTNASAITLNAEGIALTASQTDLDTANESISTNTSSISTNAEGIESLVSKTSIDGSMYTKISENSEAIGNTAGSVTTLDGRISAAESNITLTAEGVETNVTAISDANGVISEHADLITANAEGITQKVSFTSNDGNLQEDATLSIQADETGSKIMLDASEVVLKGTVKADQIDVDDLMAEEITVKNRIISEGYTEDGDGDGFSLNHGGILTARKAILKDIRIEVGDDSEKLFWIQEGQLADSKTISESQYKRFSIAEKLSAYQSSITYDGQTGINSGFNSKIQTVTSDDSSITDLKMYITHTTTLKFNLHTGVGTYSAYQTVKKNGSTVHSGSSTYTATFSAGDYVEITGGYYISQVSYQQKHTVHHDAVTVSHPAVTHREYVCDDEGHCVSHLVTDEAAWTETIKSAYKTYYYTTEYKDQINSLKISMDNVQTTSGESVLFTLGSSATTTNHVTKTIYVKETFTTGYFSNKSLKIGSTFQQNTYTYMNGFYSVVPKLERLYKIDTTQTSIYERNSSGTNVKQDFRYMKVTGSNEVVFVDANYNVLSSKVDGSSNNNNNEFVTETGWGKYFGTVTIYAEERGIVCDMLLPFKHDNGTISSAIGSVASPFKNIYSEQFHGKTYAT